MGSVKSVGTRTFRMKIRNEVLDLMLKHFKFFPLNNCERKIEVVQISDKNCLKCILYMLKDSALK